MTVTMLALAQTYILLSTEIIAYENNFVITKEHLVHVIFSDLNIHS